MQKLILIGHVGKIERITAKSGAQFTKFTVCSNDRDYTTKDGRTIEGEARWHDCIAFNGLGDMLARYLQKSRQVYVEGKVKAIPWTDKNGEARASLQVVVEKFEFLGSKSDGNGPVVSADNGQAAAVSNDEEEAYF